MKRKRLSRSDAAKKMWEDPAYRSKVTASVNKLWATDAYRAKQRIHPWRQGLMFQNPYNKKHARPADNRA
jgi:hypothetical protein